MSPWQIGHRVSYWEQGKGTSEDFFFYILFGTLSHGILIHLEKDIMLSKVNDFNHWKTVVWTYIDEKKLFVPWELYLLQISLDFSTCWPELVPFSLSGSWRFLDLYVKKVLVYCHYYTFINDLKMVFSLTRKRNLQGKSLPQNHFFLTKNVFSPFCIIETSHEMYGTQEYFFLWMRINTFNKQSSNNFHGIIVLTRPEIFFLRKKKQRPDHKMVSKIG